MAKLKGIKGLDNVLKNLEQEITKITGNVSKGVVKGALLILRESKKLTPIRLGNLRSSGYVVVAGASNPDQAQGGGFKGDDAAEMGNQHMIEKSQAEAQAQAVAGGPLDAVVAVGYSAVYALSVHENPNAGSSGNTSEADKARKGKKAPLATIHSKKGQWKFLEEPLKTNAGKLLEIIRREARI